MIVLVPSRFELSLLWPSCEGSEAAGGAFAGEPGVVVAQCGTGLAEAGAGAATHFARHAAREAILVGLAGTLDEGALPVGSVLWVTEAELDGIGAGEGDEFRALGLMEGPLSGEPFAPSRRLATPPAAVPGIRGTVLSVASAAASPDMVRRRRRHHAAALAEDMETHAVATAAELAGVRLACVRGISNVAGDRRHASWRVTEALGAVQDAVAALLREGW